MKPGYKQTEVGVIPEDWEVSDLGPHCVRITKGTTPTTIGRQYQATGVLFVKAESIREVGTIDHARCAHIDNETDLLLERSRLQRGDLLVSIAGVLGRVGRVDQSDLPANTNQALSIVRLREAGAIRPGFVFYWLRSPQVQKQIRDINVQAAQANISLKNVREFLVVVPPTEEQRAIAEALSDADALIESLKALIAKKRLIKQGAMQELLTGKRRLPGFSGEWETKRLGSFVTLQRGFDLPSRMRRPGNVPIVSSSGVDSSHDVAMIESPGVVTGRYGTIGLVFYVESSFWPLNTTLFVSSFHGNCARFAFYILQTIDFASHSGKSGVPGVNRNDLHELEIRVPVSAGEQKAIATVLSDLDSELEALETKLHKARVIKQGMMQELLTGRTRLVPAEAS